MITIKEITKRSDIIKFIEFPIKMYKHNPYYIPCFVQDEMILLNPKKNPAYAYCETRLFLAYENKKIVGRICAMINKAYNEKKGLKQMRFNRFDVIDDLEVTKLLMKQVEDWAKERGLTQIIGPIGFSDLDKQGLLVEGFEEEGNTITLYNHPYYMKHLEALNFRKDVDWVEYQVFTPASMNDRITRLAAAISHRYGYKVVKVNKRKDIKLYARDAFHLINESFEHLYGVVPLSDRQIDDTVKQFISIVNMEFLYFITNKTDELIGFGLLVPSLNKATKPSNGRLFPFGFLRVLKALRTYKVLDMYLVGVKPQYQKLGVNALILLEGIKSAIKCGVQLAETGPELENNLEVRSQWREFETRQHRRRRCYVRDLS
ncbi:MAG: hypothetical protein AB7T03_06605 [Bacilli bacterium]